MANICVKEKGVLWVYASRFLAIGINILLLPFIMKFFSEDELGLWYVFSSISQIVNLFDFGFNSTISRHMTYAWCGADHLEKTSVTGKYREEPNVELVSEIIQTCRVVYLLISCVAFVVMTTVGTSYIFSITHAVMTKNILLAWIIYIVSTFMNMFYGYWASILQGIGAVAERSRMNVYAKLIQFVIAVVLVISGMGLLGFVISYFISGIVLRILGKYYFDLRTIGLELEKRVGFTRIRRCLSNIWGTSWKDGLVMLANFLSTQAHTLICGYYVGLVATGVYGMMTQIVSIIASVAASYFTAYQPAFTNACMKKDWTEQRKIICMTNFIYKGIFLVGTVALFIVGIPFLHIIRPNIEIGICFVVLVCVFYYFFTQKDLFASMIASYNEVPFWKAYIVTALASVCLSVVFTQNGMGIYGLVLAQLATNMIYNCWKWPLYLMKRANVVYFDIYYVGFDYLKNIVGIMSARNQERRIN